MVRKSRSRSVASGVLGLALVLAGGVALSAHRTDEYLQAARLAIDPARVQIELDLTPGIAMAETILADIDRDRDGSLSAEPVPVLSTNRCLLVAPPEVACGRALCPALVSSHPTPPPSAMSRPSTSTSLCHRGMVAMWAPNWR